MGEPSGAQGLQVQRERLQVRLERLAELHSGQQPESRPSQFEAARRRPYRFEAAPVRLCRSSAVSGVSALFWGLLWGENTDGPQPRVGLLLWGIKQGRDYMGPCAPWGKHTRGRHGDHEHAQQCFDTHAALTYF